MRENVWEEGQLNDDLQRIVAVHRNHFNRQPVEMCNVDTETESKSE